MLHLDSHLRPLPDRDIEEIRDNRVDIRRRLGTDLQEDAIVRRVNGEADNRQRLGIDLRLYLESAVARYRLCDVCANFTYR